MNYLDKDLLDELAEYLVENIHRRRVSFPVSTGDTLTVNVTELSDNGQTLALRALEAWSEISGLIFEPVEHDDAHIHFSESHNLDPQTAGTTSFSAQGNFLIHAEITISSNVDEDEYIFDALLHEIGHALGLYHPAHYITPVRYGIDNNFTNDSYQATVMSYFNQYENTDLDADYALPVTPMSADILAIHKLYGTPTIREGDTVYGGSNSNVSGHLGTVLTDLTAGNLDSPVTLTIIDHGGYDIIDFSSHDENNPGYIRTMVDETTFRKEPGIIGQRVNLNPGWASDVYNVKGALVIAHDTIIEGYYAGAGNDHITGNMADNWLDGGPGNDTLIGGPGDDYLEGRSGADTLDGGPGSDMATYFNSDAGVEVHVSGTIVAGGHANGDMLLNIEDLQGSSYNDILTGDSNSNILSGIAGNDRLDGGAGDDLLDGGSGADTLDGGSGYDVASYVYSDSSVIVHLNDNTTAGGDANGDTLRNIESLIGSIFDDTLTGNSTDNELYGEAGNDWLIGGPGNDNLFGGPGSDHLSGETGNDKLSGGQGNDNLAGDAGNDHLSGGPGNDSAYYSASDTGVTVRLHSQTAIGGHADGDLFTTLIPVTWTDDTGATQTEQLPDIENLVGSMHNDVLAGDRRDNTLYGNAGDDTLYGGPGGGNDWLAGQAGNDKLFGGQGDDHLEGGSGNDQLAGGPGDDRAYYTTSDTGVTVRLHSRIAIGGHADGDLFTTLIPVTWTDDTGATQTEQLPDIENLVGSMHNDVLAGDRRDNTLYGNAGDDTLYGGPGGGDDWLYGEAGNDKLFGGQGNDQLDGGPGNDRLTGGTGADTFIFGPGNGDDIIINYESNVDKIDLTAFELDNIDEVSMTTDDDGVTLDLAGVNGGTVLLADLSIAPSADEFIV